MQYIPLIGVIVGLIALSAIFSGLNVAFMSLDIRDLQRKAKLGDRYAKTVLPLRENSHLTLAAILYTNIGAVTATGLVMQNFTGGVIAGFVSTILLVIFGEILPQAYFNRMALTITGRLAPLLRFAVVVTYPFSKPTQLLLAKVVPDSEHTLQSRGELGLMMHEYKATNSNELDEGEVEIIQGALQLSNKRASDIMTPIKEVFWLDYNNTAGW